MAEVIYTKNAPDAIGPYSQAIKTNGLVFTSGQIAINPATGSVEATTIEGQTEQVMKNLQNLLEAAGSSLEKAVKTVCFLADMNDFAAFNEIYGKYFKTPYCLYDEQNCSGNLSGYFIDFSTSAENCWQQILSALSLISTLSNADNSHLFH